MDREFSTHWTDKKCAPILFGKPERKDQSGDLAVGGMIILEWILGE
jgi:hypothetical protein